MFKTTTHKLVTNFLQERRKGQQLALQNWHNEQEKYLLDIASKKPKGDYKTTRVLKHFLDIQKA